MLAPCGLLILFDGWNRAPVQLFWLALANIIGFAFLQIGDFLKEQSVIVAVLTSSLVVWSIATAFIWVGTEIFAFAEPAVQSAHTLLVLLDIRYISIAIFVLAGSIAAIGSAARHPIADVPDFPRVQLGRFDNHVHMLLRAIGVPIVITTNLLLGIFCFVVNVMWHLLAVTTVYLFRFGAELGLLLRDSVLQKPVLLLVFKMSCSIVLVVLMFASLTATGETQMVYLKSTSWVDGVSPLLHISGVALCAIFGAILTLRMWTTEPINRIAIEHVAVIAHLCVAAFIAGIGAMVLAQVKWLGMESFRVLGPFSGGFGIVVGTGLIVWLVRNGVIIDRR
jgi:hypothetical protein